MQFPRELKKKAFLPKDQRHSKFQKEMFDTCFLKVPSFSYLCLFVEKLKRIKAKTLKGIEDFCIVK